MVDYYHTEFNNQVVANVCTAARYVIISNLDARGRSYAQSLQGELQLEPLSGMQAKGACEYLDVRTTYDDVLDVPSKVLTVTYQPDKTSPAALRTAVQKTGYDADDLAAEPRAYGRLPNCCRKTSTGHSAVHYPPFALSTRPPKGPGQKLTGAF